MDTWTGQDNLSLLIGADRALTSWIASRRSTNTDLALETIASQFGVLPDSPGRAASMRLSLHNLAREEITEHEPFDDADGIYSWVDRKELVGWRQRAENLLKAELVPGDAIANLALWQIITLGYSDAEVSIRNLSEILGPYHSQVMMIRYQLAWSAVSTDRGHDLAIRLGEALLTDNLCSLGPDHEDTIRARRDLGYFYWAADRSEEEIHHREIVIRESERVLGADHPDTIMARSELSWSYWSVERFAEAFELRKLVFSDFESILGPDHPETINARSDLEVFRQSLSAET